MARLQYRHRLVRAECIPDTKQLARIAKAYPAIPAIVPDGIYGPKTKAAVEKFQAVFGLPVSGVVDYNTWYEISNIYVAVTRIAELA